MRRLPILYIVLVIVLIGAIPLVSAETITFNPATVTVSQGDTQNITLLLDGAPQGLAGYLFNVVVTNPGTTRIMDVSYPAWAGLSSTTGVPGESITMSAVDLNRQVQAGATGVILGTITVQGGTAGTSIISLGNVQMDGDGGGVIDPVTHQGTIIVSMSGIPVTWTPAQTTVPATVTTTATSTTGSSSSDSGGSGGGGGGSGDVTSGTSSAGEPSGSVPATMISTAVQTPGTVEAQTPFTTIPTSMPATAPLLQQPSPQGGGIIPGGLGISGIPWVFWIVGIILVVVTLIILYLAVTKKI